jgi:hypothetical protein
MLQVHLSSNMKCTSRVGRVLAVNKIRVCINYAMDRPVPDNAFMKPPHWKAPFCVLHASMRITEALLKNLQVT